MDRARDMGLGIADASLADASLADASLADASLADASLADASLADASLVVRGLAAPDPASDRRTVRLLALAVGLVGCVVFLGTLPNDFVLDDVPAIVENPSAHWPPDLGRVFTTNFWGSPRDFEHLTIYRPLATLTFALGDALHGPAPWGVHLGNALLHGVVSALVVLLGAVVFGRGRVRSTRRGVPPAAVAAGAAGLLFAVHPVHVEAVAGAVSRAEILAAAFVLATLLLALRARAPGARRWRWWAGATITFALGLLSKENGATALLMLPLLDLAEWLRARRDGDPRARPVVAWPLWLACAGVLAGYFVLRAAVLPAVLGGAVPPSDNPMVATAVAGVGPVRWMTPFAVYLEAWRVLVWPASLSVDYTAHALPVATSWLDPRGLGGVALFVATLLAALAAARRRPDLSLSIGIFLAAYAVVSHLAFPATVIFAERLLYLPSVGVCLLAGGAFAWSIASDRARGLRAAAWAAGVVVVALATWRTVLRTADWRDELTLYATSVVETPGSARLQNNLGLQLLARGDLPRAVRAFQTAVQIDPGNFSAWSNLGQAALQVGEWDAAAGAIHEALRRKPDLVEAWNNLCVLERLRGRAEAGVPACRSALERAPDVATLHFNLVRALLAAGRSAEAAAALAEARARFPRHPEIGELERALGGVRGATEGAPAEGLPGSPRP